MQDSGNGLAITNNGEEKDLENLCMEQATKIEQLNQLVIILLITPLTTAIHISEFTFNDNLNFFRLKSTNRKENIIS